jgi:sulfopyruvate decarboxylase subunit alpha
MTTPKHTVPATLARVQSVDPRSLLATIRAIGITHVITVPDTHQRTLLGLLGEANDPRLVTVCTEDEAIAINAGLYVGRARPMLLIQNNGFYACLNTVKAIAIDGRVPTFMLIGEHGRNPELPSRENKDLSVRMLEPTLEVWGIPYQRLETHEDVGKLPESFERCVDTQGPMAVLVCAPTAEALPI